MLHCVSLHCNMVITVFCNNFRNSCVCTANKDPPKKAFFIEIFFFQKFRFSIVLKNGRFQKTIFKKLVVSLTIVNYSPPLPIVNDDPLLTIVNEERMREETDLKGIGTFSFKENIKKF